MKKETGRQAKRLRDREAQGETETEIERQKNNIKEVQAKDIPARVNLLPDDPRAW